ncbi:MAG: T9SS type A sorting domain-containing protein [Rubricoccaceae bacterium]
MPGVPDNVFAVATGPDGSVYVGGDFTTAGETPALGVARWTGETWEALGSGLAYENRTAIAYALTFGPDGALYVGGQFQTAGGVPANAVARWDGAAWAGLGDGLTGATFPSVPLVRGLAFNSDGDLFVGGAFTTAGGQPALNAARWDGEAWHPLGSGVNQSPLAVLAGPGGDVVFAGRFTQAGGISAPGVARWDGKAWNAYGSGLTLPFLTGGAFAAAFDGEGRLYVGGAITGAGGQSVANVARWDGNAWSAVGAGLSGGSVLALRYEPTRNLIYAGGRFTNSGGAALPRVAAWDGSSWQALGAGVAGGSSPVVYGFSMPAPDGSLFASGAFEVAGGEAARGVARWVAAGVSQEPGVDGAGLALEAFPNPAAERVSLAFTLAAASPVRLEVFDALGRSVAVLLDEVRPAGMHAAALEAGALAPGVYVARLTTSAERAARRVTVVR